MHECERIRSLPSEKFLKKLEESLRNKGWSEMRTFGRENREVSRERDRVKFVLDRTGSLNSASSNSRQMQVSRSIKISIEEGVEKMVVDS